MSVTSPAFANGSSIAAESSTQGEAVLRLRSAHDVDETVARLKTAIAEKSVRLFCVIDQSGLGKDAGVPIGRSTLVLFGNPPLGLQFLQVNRYSGLDWPVRMLVVKEADGSVWLAWSDFASIARRYRITDRAAQLKTQVRRHHARGGGDFPLLGEHQQDTGGAVVVGRLPRPMTAV
jgi:uncharacterized protein (DUF302 family)